MSESNYHEYEFFQDLLHSDEDDIDAVAYYEDDDYDYDNSNSNEEAEGSVNSEPKVDADDIINSLHLNVPELRPNEPQLQPQQPQPHSRSTRMTDLGFKMSQMILKQQHRSSAAPESYLDVDEGDQLVDNYGQRRHRPRPGKRGRPKGSVKDATTQFGRNSSTHALPPAVAALMGRANVAYVQRQYDQAIELYLQVVQRAPSSPEPYYSLGLVWEERGDFDRAASYFLIAAHLQGRPEAELWRKIAALLVQVPERKDQAIYALTRAIKRAGRAEAELYLLRAKLHLELHQYRQVITSLGGLLRQKLRDAAADQDDDDDDDAKNFDVFAFLARIALHMSLAYLAASVLEEAMNWALRQGFPISFGHLNLLTELRAVDEDWLSVLTAVETFLPACHQSTGHEQGSTEWWLLADSQRLLRALQAAPAELRFVYRLAAYRLRRADVTTEALLEAFLGLPAPRPQPLIRQLTDALMDAGEYAEALKVYASPETTQMTTEMAIKMAEAYMRIGDFASAEESIYAVLHVDKDCRKAKLSLAEIYRATGRVEEALQVLPPESANEPSHQQPHRQKEEFINWTALDSLFDRFLDVKLELQPQPCQSAEANAADDDEAASSGSSGTSTPTTTNNNNNKRRLRFGPERMKRLRSAKIVREKGRPLSQTQVVALRRNLALACNENNLKAALELLNACVSSEAQGLNKDEWGLALQRAVLLQTRQPSCDFRALLRVLKQVLDIPLLANEHRIRLAFLLVAERAAAWEEVLGALRWFISMAPASSTGYKLLRALAHRSPQLARLALQPNFFRFLARRQSSHSGSVPLHLSLGHQSLATHNYDEAARQYWLAARSAPHNPFVSLCLGNALLWRAFQRTCANPPAKLIEAFAHWQRHVQLSAGSVRSRYNYARALQIAGFPGEAVKVYREIEGDFPPARYNLSRLLLQSNK